MCSLCPSSFALSLLPRPTLCLINWISSSFLKGSALYYSLLCFKSFLIPGSLLLLPIGAYPSSQAGFCTTFPHPQESVWSLGASRGGWGRGDLPSCSCSHLPRGSVGTGCIWFILIPLLSAGPVLCWGRWGVGGCLSNTGTSEFIYTKM